MKTILINYMSLITLEITNRKNLPTIKQP